MPQLSEKAFEFNEELEKLSNKLDAQESALTHNEEITLLMINHMFPRDKMFRFLLTSFVSTFATVNLQGNAYDFEDRLCELFDKVSVEGE